MLQVVRHKRLALIPETGDTPHWGSLAFSITRLLSGTMLIWVTETAEI